MEMNIAKEYTRDGVTVVWQPHICIHSGICAKELSAVFNPFRRPWIDINGAPVDRIVEQVEGCPSGALSWRRDPKPD